MRDDGDSGTRNVVCVVNGCTSVAAVECSDDSAPYCEEDDDLVGLPPDVAARGALGWSSDLFDGRLPAILVEVNAT